MNQAIVTCSPDFRDLAENELRRAIKSVEVQSEIAPGTFLIEFPLSFDSFAGHWHRRPPIYLHHLCPVQKRLPLPDNRFQIPRILADLQRSVRQDFLQTFHPRCSFAVQARVLGCFPCTLASPIESMLERLILHCTKAPWNPRAPRQVLSIVLGDNEAFLGVSLTAQNISPWPGGARPYPLDPYRLNRAELKLLEAMEVFRIRLQLGGRALDLGSGLGGWTRVLLQHGQRVTAVDPRRLDASLANNPRVTWHRLRAEDYLCYDSDPFDFITNDMILPAAESASLMVAFAGHLRPGGMGLMTLKLPRGPRRTVMDHALRILRKAYRIPLVRQLCYNRSEVTAWLKSPRVPVAESP